MKHFSNILTVVVQIMELIGKTFRLCQLQNMYNTIVSLIDTITIGLRTTEESCPSDSSTAVITLSNFSHHVTDEDLHGQNVLPIELQCYVNTH